MTVTIILALLSTMAMGAIQIISPSVNATIAKGDSVRFTWNTGIYDTAAEYACPNEPSNTGSQYARFATQCDGTESARTQTLANFNEIYSWVVNALNTMEGPITNASRFNLRYLQTQAANLSTIGINVTQYPEFPGGQLPSTVNALEVWTLYSFPDVNVTYYPYADLKSQIFGRKGGGCNNWAVHNASAYIYNYLQYIAGMEAGGASNLAFFDQLYPLYAPYYQNVSDYYTNVLQPKAGQMLSLFGINLAGFPSLSPVPSIVLNTKPTSQHYTTGACSDLTTIENTNNPVSLELFVADVNDVNVHTIAQATNIDNAGAVTYIIPCDLATNVTDSVFFRVSTNSESSYIQFPVHPCSAAALSMSVMVYMMILFIATLF